MSRTYRKQEGERKSPYKKENGVARRITRTGDRRRRKEENRKLLLDPEEFDNLPVDFETRTSGWLCN